MYIYSNGNEYYNENIKKNNNFEFFSKFKNDKSNFKLKN